MYIYVDNYIYLYLTSTSRLASHLSAPFTLSSSRFRLHQPGLTKRPSSDETEPPRKPKKSGSSVCLACGEVVNREVASSIYTAGATANTTERNSRRASRESGLLCSHSHKESIGVAGSADATKTETTYTKTTQHTGLWPSRLDETPIVGRN